MQIEVSLFHKREEVFLKHIKDLKPFIEYSNDMKYVCKSIEDYNSVMKKNTLKVFDDKIGAQRKIYFLVLKDVRSSSTHFFIMNILKSNKFNKLLLIIFLILTSKTI